MRLELRDCSPVPPEETWLVVESVVLAPEEAYLQLRTVDRRPVRAVLAVDEEGAAVLAQAAQLHVSGTKLLDLELLPLAVEIEKTDRVRFGQADD